jgi:hypothetical protein
MKQEVDMRKTGIFTAIMLVMICVPASTMDPAVADEEGLTCIVRAEHGLKMRTSMEKNGEIVTVLPFGVEVKITSMMLRPVEIDGNKGYWTYAHCGEHAGWVFSAFLERKNDPSYRIRNAFTIYELLPWATGLTCELDVESECMDSAACTGGMFTCMTPIPPLVGLSFRIRGCGGDFKPVEGIVHRITFTIDSIDDPCRGGENDGTQFCEIIIKGKIISHVEKKLGQ